MHFPKFGFLRSDLIESWDSSESHRIESIVPDQPPDDEYGVCWDSEGWWIWRDIPEGYDGYWGPYPSPIQAVVMVILNT